jgi:hypothetical protein
MTAISYNDQFFHILTIIILSFFNNKKITLSKNNKKQKGALLIEGLPGIGNVGKIAVDFLVEDLKLFY